MFNVIASVFILVGVGYLARLTGLLKHDDADVINKVIIYIALPALIFNAVKHSTFSLTSLWMPAIALAVSGITLLVFWPVLRAVGLKGGSRGMAMLAIAAGNTGYLGYPLTERVLGESFVADAIYYDLFGTVLFLFTVGLVIGERYGDTPPGAGKLRQVLTFPGLIALVVGYVLAAVTLPPVLVSVIDMTAAATVPLIMLSIGMSLRFDRHILERLPAIAAIALAKLVLAPALAVGIALVVGLGPGLVRVAVLEASMPTAMLAFIVGARYGLDERLGSSAIVVTTVLSALTVPLWQSLVS